MGSKKGGSGNIPGLEPLVPLNSIFMRQQVDGLEVAFGMEQANRYIFYGTNGKMLYQGVETSDCCAREYCGNYRSFQVYIRDTNGSGIFLDRQSFCGPSSLSVFAISTKQLLGKVEEASSGLFSGARFNIKDDRGKVVFIIKAPFSTSSMGANVNFDLFYANNMKTPIGKITKKWAGLGQEMLTHADNFGISFPGNLSVKMKAVLLGASVLIDFRFYEKKGGRR